MQENSFSFSKSCQIIFIQDLKRNFTTRSFRSSLRRSEKRDSEQDRKWIWPEIWIRPESYQKKIYYFEKKFHYYWKQIFGCKLKDVITADIDIFCTFSALNLSVEPTWNHTDDSSVWRATFGQSYKKFTICGLQPKYGGGTFFYKMSL